MQLAERAANDAASTLDVDRRTDQPRSPVSSRRRRISSRPCGSAYSPRQGATYEPSLDIFGACEAAGGRRHLVTVREGRGGGLDIDFSREEGDVERAFTRGVQICPNQSAQLKPKGIGAAASGRESPTKPDFSLLIGSRMH